MACDSAFINGGFETGVFSPWVVGSGSQSLVIYLPKSGIYSTELENIAAAPGSITQEIANVGADCIMGFWVRSGGWTVGNETLWEGSFQVKFHSPSGEVTIGPLIDTQTPIWGEWRAIVARWPESLLESPITITIEALNGVINVDSVAFHRSQSHVAITLVGQFPNHPSKEITFQREIESVWTDIVTPTSDGNGYYICQFLNTDVPPTVEGNYRAVVEGVPISTQYLSYLDFEIKPGSYYFPSHGNGYTYYTRNWNERPRTALEFEGILDGPGTVEIKRYYESQSIWESIGFGTADATGAFKVPNTGYCNLIPGRDKIGTYQIFLDSVLKGTLELLDSEFCFIGTDTLHMQFKGNCGGGPGCPTVFNGDFEGNSPSGWLHGENVYLYTDALDPFEGSYSMYAVREW